MKGQSEDPRLRSNYLRMADYGGGPGIDFEEEKMTWVYACVVCFAREVRWDLKQYCLAAV